MTLQELQCFLMVAKTGSYTKTAQELFISQPAVSKHISALEQELGATLVDRTIRRNIRLTQAGEIFYESLCRCQVDFSEALSRIQEITAASPLVVNVSEDCTLPEWLFQIFNTFNDLLGPVPLDINFISYDEFPAALNRGELVLTSKDGLVPGKNLEQRPIHSAPVPYYIIASALHPAFKGSREPEPSDFSQSPLFLPKAMPPTLRERYIKYVSGFTGTKPGLLLLDSMDTVSLYLKGNTGMTITTSWYKHFHSPEIRSVPLGISTTYFIQWNPSKNINKKLDLLLDII